MESAPIIVSGMLALTSILLTIVGFLIAMLIKDVKGAIVILTKEVHGVSENYVESRVRLDNVERQAMRIVQMGEDVATMKYAMMSYLDKTKRDS